MNRYSYTFNNPLSYTDPTGYFADSGPAGAVVGVVNSILGSIFGGSLFGGKKTAAERAWDAWMWRLSAKQAPPEKRADRASEARGNNPRPEPPPEPTPPKTPDSPAPYGPAAGVNKGGGPTQSGNADFEKVEIEASYTCAKANLCTPRGDVTFAQAAVETLIVASPVVVAVLAPEVLSGTVVVAAKTAIGLPSNPGQLRHIFRNAPGHLLDTPANRKLLSDVASNPAYRIGTDRFGNVWSAVAEHDHLF